jgi:hypothetical protein
MGFMDAVGEQPKKKKPKVKRVPRIIGFLRGELLRDAYDDGNRFERLLWTDGEDGAYAALNKRQFWDEEYNGEERKVDEKRGDMELAHDGFDSLPRDWVDDLDDDDIHLMWSELLSCRNLTNLHIPQHEYSIEVEHNGVFSSCSFSDTAAVVTATKDYLQARALFVSEYLNKRKARRRKKRTGRTKERPKKKADAARTGEEEGLGLGLGLGGEGDGSTSGSTKTSSVDQSDDQNRAQKRGKRKTTKNAGGEDAGSSDENDDDDDDDDEDDEEEEEDDSSVESSETIDDNVATPSQFHAQKWHRPDPPADLAPMLRVKVSGRRSSAIYSQQKHKLRQAASFQVERKISYISKGGDLRSLWQLDSDLFSGRKDDKRLESDPGAGAADDMNDDVTCDGTDTGDNKVHYVRFINLPPAPGRPGGWEGKDVSSAEAALLGNGWAVLELAEPTEESVAHDALLSVLGSKHRPAPRRVAPTTPVADAETEEQRSHRHTLGGTLGFHQEYCRHLREHLQELCKALESNVDSTLTANGDAKQLHDVRRSIELLYSYEGYNNSDRDLLMQVDLGSYADRTAHSTGLPSLSSVPGWNLVAEKSLVASHDGCDASDAALFPGEDDGTVGSVLGADDGSYASNAAFASPIRVSIAKKDNNGSFASSVYHMDENSPESSQPGAVSGLSPSLGSSPHHADEGSKDTNLASVGGNIATCSSNSGGKGGVLRAKGVDAELDVVDDPCQVPLTVYDRDTNFEWNKAVWTKPADMRGQRVTTAMWYEEAPRATFEQLTGGLDEEHRRLVSPRAFVPVTMKDPFQRAGKEYYSSPRKEDGTISANVSPRAPVNAPYSPTEYERARAALGAPVGLARNQTSTGRPRASEAYNGGEHPTTAPSSLQGAEKSGLRGVGVGKREAERAVVMPNVEKTASASPPSSALWSDQLVLGGTNGDNAAILSPFKSSSDAVDITNVRAEDEVQAAEQLKVLSSMILTHLESRGLQGFFSQLPGAAKGVSNKTDTVSQSQELQDPTEGGTTATRGGSRSAESALFEHVAYTWYDFPEELQRRSEALGGMKQSILDAHVQKNLRDVALSAQKDLNSRLDSRRRAAAAAGLVVVPPVQAEVEPGTESIAEVTLKRSDQDGVEPPKETDRLVKTTDKVQAVPATGTADLTGWDDGATPWATCRVPAEVPPFTPLFLDAEETGMVARRTSATVRGGATTRPAFLEVDDLEELVPEVNALEHRTPQLTSPRVPEQRESGSRGCADIARQALAAKVGMRPSSKSHLRPRFAHRLLKVPEKPVDDFDLEPEPEPEPEPAPQPAPKPKEKYQPAKFTVSGRGTLVYHQAVGEAPEQNYGMSPVKVTSATPTAPFGTRAPHSHETIKLHNAPADDITFLTSVRDSGSTSDLLKPPLAVADSSNKGQPQAPEIPAATAQAYHKHHARLVSSKSKLAKQVLHKLQSPQEDEEEEDFSTFIQEDTAEPEVDLRENEEGEVLLLETSPLMELFIPMLFEQTGAQVGTICSTFEGCSQAVSRRNSNLHYADRAYAYEYLFLSFTDIMTANVDNISEGLLQETEDENKVLHFVYKFKKEQRLREQQEQDARPGGLPRSVSGAETRPPPLGDNSVVTRAESAHVGTAGGYRKKLPLGEEQWSDAYLQRISSTIDAILDIKVASAAKLVVIYNVPINCREKDVRDLWLSAIENEKAADKILFGDLTLLGLKDVLGQE